MGNIEGIDKTKPTVKIKSFNDTIPKSSNGVNIVSIITPNLNDYKEDVKKSEIIEVGNNNDENENNDSKPKQYQTNLTPGEQQMQELPKEGKISSRNIDFTRIAVSSDRAKNGEFIKVNHPEYWGDDGNLTYKIVNDVVYIYEGDTVLGFTDLQGIGYKSPNTTSNDSEPIIEDPAHEAEIYGK